MPSVADYFPDIISNSDAEILAQLRHFSNKAKMYNSRFKENWV